MLKLPNIFVAFREFLIAMILVADDFHSGQDSDWYRRGCLAREYLLRWYQVDDIYQWLGSRCIKQSCKKKVNKFYAALIHKHFPEFVQ